MLDTFHSSNFRAFRKDRLKIGRQEAIVQRVHPSVALVLKQILNQTDFLISPPVDLRADTKRANGEM